MSTVDALKDYVIVLGSTDSPELTTHLNYVKYLWSNTKSLRLTYKNTIGKNSSLKRKDFKDRVNLIKLTYKSLNEEAKQVEGLHEYARACSAWIAIKSYYLLFYLETILLSLILTQNKLKASHGEVRKLIKNLGRDGSLKASFVQLSVVITHAECEKSGVKSGANLRGQLSDADRYKQLMKKLREYSQEEYKRSNKLKRMTKLHSANFSKQKISLADFFYWYRIKSNYRDLEFIAGDEAKMSDLYDFYRMYNQAVINVSKAYVRLINEVYANRTDDKEALIQL